MVGLGEYVQVGTHDDEKVVPLGNFCFEELGVFDGLLGRVDGAWTDDDKELVVVTSEDSRGAVAGNTDGTL